LSRATSAVSAHHRHKKVLAVTRGHRATNHSLYKRAHESMVHALDYSYRHRREKKGDMRRLWITRINAACRQSGISYSVFMANLREQGITINRKVLADIAAREPDDFARLVQSSLAKE